jgi:hypothetical protein
MRYKSFSYLWPPRPEQAVPDTQLGFYQKQGYAAQIKKNGTCSIIAVSPEGKLTFMNRHNEDHKLWSPVSQMFPELIALHGDGWYYFVGELLHSKVKVADGGVRDTLYLHDCLVNNGEYLVGETQQERYDALCDIFLKGNEPETYSHYIVSPKLWIARQYTDGFAALFNDLTQAEDEGLVLKNPKERLQIASRQRSNVAGQVKCRKSHKNYSF